MIVGKVVGSVVSTRKSEDVYKRQVRSSPDEYLESALRNRYERTGCGQQGSAGTWISGCFYGCPGRSGI